MKNYLLILLIVIILVLISFMYRSNHTNILNGFFKTDLKNIDSINDQFYLVLIFSKHNCEPCLEVIEVLNNLPEHFKVIGLVPERELADEEDLRNKTNAKFELIGLKKFKRYIPPYAPTLFGISQNDEIFFILPGVPYEKNYLE